MIEGQDLQTKSSKVDTFPEKILEMFGSIGNCSYLCIVRMSSEGANDLLS